MKGAIFRLPCFTMPASQRGVAQSGGPVFEAMDAIRRRCYTRSMTRSTQTTLLLTLCEFLLIASVHAAEPRVISIIRSTEPKAQLEMVPGGLVNRGLAEVHSYFYILDGPQMIHFTAPGESQSIRVMANVRDSHRYYGDWDVTDPSMGTTYRTLDPTVATVSADGVVTARGHGFTTLEIRNSTALSRAFVEVDTFSELTELRVIPPGKDAEILLEFVGAQHPLRVEGIFSSGNTYDIRGNTLLSYSIDHSSIAAVSKDGFIFARAPGLTRLHVEYGASRGVQYKIARSTSIIVRVRNVAKLSFKRLQLGTPAMRLFNIGARAKIHVSGFFSDGRVATISSPLTGLRIRSKTRDIVSVDSDGVATALRPGRATITASLGKLSATGTIDVRPSRLKSLSIWPIEGVIGVPMTKVTNVVNLKLNVTGVLEDGSSLDLSAPEAGTEYSSSDTNVASVSSEGRVAGTETGWVTITARNSGIAASARFRVNRFSPTPAGVLPGKYTGVAVSSGVAYLVTNSKKFWVADVKDPFKPRLLDGVRTRGNTLSAFVSERSLFVVHTRGVSEFDLSISTRPTHLRTISASASAAALDKDRLYMVAGKSLHIFAAHSQALLGELEGLPSAGGLIDVSDGIAYVANGNILRVFDVSNPERIAGVGQANLPGDAVDVIATRGHAVVSVRNKNGDSVVAFDATRLPAVSMLSPAIPDARGACFHGDWLLTVGDASGGRVMVYDIANLTKPAIVGAIQFPLEISGRKVITEGRRAYIIADRQPSDRANPKGSLYIASMDYR